MQLTRRGYGAVAVAAIAIAMAWLTGPRALNAAAVPVLVALAAGAVQVSRAGAPTVERTQPRRGFPGERRTVALTVDGGAVAVVEDRVPKGLSVVGDASGVLAVGASPAAREAGDGRDTTTARFQRTLPATLGYDVDFERRGVWPIGPARITVRDVLGLVQRTYEAGGTTEVVVFPRVYSIDAASVFGRTLGPEMDDRTEFERLREYVPGDRLRDVHWKTSAKYDDLLVTEYTDPTDDETVSVVAEGQPAVADEMAAAAATLVVGAIRTGLTVELTVPSGSLPPGYGETHRRHALDLLARTAGGEVPEDARAEADVLVSASEEGVAVTVDEHEYDLDSLRTDGDHDDPLVSEVTA